VNKREKITIVALFGLFFCLFVPKQIHAAPSSNPIYTTLSQVQQLITTALTPIANLLSNHQTRIDALENKVLELENRSTFTFFDNFNDGNTNGWLLGNAIGFPSHSGNWRVEEGKLVQDTGYDGVVALIENLQFSTQTVETNVKLFGPSGGGGIAVWFKDTNNALYVTLANETLGVGQVTNGTWDNFSFPVSYNINENKFANLRVEGNSNTGDIKVYLDNEYKFTYHATTPNRLGQSGVITGNAGASFDDFRISVIF
jgi:hypothetical protein